MSSAADPLQRPRPPGFTRGVARLGGALVLLALLAGCSSTIEKMPAAIGGLPTDAPDRAADPVAFPAVHDMPPPRDNAMLTAEQQKKAAADLAAARDRQEKRAGAKDQ